MYGIEAALHEDSLAFLGQEELDEGVRRLGMGGALEDGHRLRGHIGVFRVNEHHIVAAENLSEGHVTGNRHTDGELALGYYARHVAGAGRKDPRIGRQSGQPVPALFPAVHGQDHFIARMARARPVRCALGNVALEFGVEQIVPVLDRDAESLEQLRLIDQAVGFQRRSYPESFGVLQGSPTGLPMVAGISSHIALGMVTLSRRP